MPRTCRHRSKRTKRATSRSRSRPKRSRSRSQRKRASRLSPRAKSRANRIRQRRALSLLGGANVECPICFECLRDASGNAREGEDAYKVVTPNTCTHRFHEACLNKIRERTCPVCRRAFTSLLPSEPDVLNVEQEQKEEAEQADLTRRAAEAARREAEASRRERESSESSLEPEPVLRKREPVREPRETRQVIQTIPEFDSRVYYSRRKLELLEAVGF